MKRLVINEVKTRISHALLLLLPLGALFSLSACDSGFQKIEASEHAVVFSAIPRFIGGGVRDKVLQPGEMEFVFPWESLYRLDTSLQSIAWGGVGSGDRKEVEDYVETRALDGNEVGLAITVQYHIIPEKVPYIIQNVGIDDLAIKSLVTAVARADIRTHMNVLNTRDFFSPEKRQSAVDQVKLALKGRLEPEGIAIDNVIYNDHRFERRLQDGTVDRSYQEQIDRTQAINQETQQEKKKIATVVESKKQEFSEAQALVNRRVQEAEGFKRQATLRGDGFLQAKKNEAEQVTALGTAEVEGLKKQIAALSGPGGRALLKLALVDQLLKGNSKFILLNNGKGGAGAIDINRVDSNDLLREAGIFAAMQDGANANRPAQRAPEAAVAPAITPAPIAGQPKAGAKAKP